MTLPATHQHRTLPAIERFWLKVDRTGSCWTWQGYVMVNGYGKFRDRSYHLAHRWIYEYVNGPIADGLVIDHLCRNRRCVRPSHLEAVTMRENLRRGTGLVAINLAKTACAHGHPYDEDNTLWRQGQRHCRACISRQNKRQYEKRKAQLMSTLRRSGG